MAENDATAAGAPAGDGIEIVYYEDWMLPQVVDLFVDEYGTDRSVEEAAFRQFFEHPYQRSRGIRLVAVDGDRVCGFQSFVFWPYVFDGREMQTFQSGRSLVSPDYRGRRIFARLLDFLFETEHTADVDFVVGFPVEMSYGSFIRNGWANPLDLAWYLRVLHPLSVVRSPGPIGLGGFDDAPLPVDAQNPAGSFSMSRDPEFAAWQASFRADRRTDRYAYFHYGDGAKRLRFELKPKRRGRVAELIVGDIAGKTEDPVLLRNGLRALVRQARRDRSLTILTMALNTADPYPGLVASLHRAGFVRIRPKIYFIVKPVRDVPEIHDAGRWRLMYRDIDTW